MTAGATTSVHKKNIVFPSESLLSFSVTKNQPGKAVVTIKIPKDVINTLFHEAARIQQPHIRAAGFDFGAAPLEYIKQNYASSLVDHLKEFLFKYCVISYLYRMLQKQKIVVAGDPRITNIHIAPGEDATYEFTCSTLDTIPIHEWRYFPFRAPKRKNYKDLDRQVEHFIAQEESSKQQYAQNGITKNDWVALQITLATEDGKPLIKNFANCFWVQVSDEQVDNPLRDLLYGKYVGDTILTQIQTIQDYFSEEVSTNYHFLVTILEQLPHVYFCFEQCKNNFRIKTKKELNKKLIEVFSFRNDISQRRSTVEECLKLLLSKHTFEVPKHLVLRFQQYVMTSVKKNPDYNVYKTQKDFEQLIIDLAEKQAKEVVFLDTFAYHEKVDVSRNDIKNYLNFSKRNRTKEFIFCRLPVIDYEGQSTLIPEEEIKRYCLREKAINYAIHHLTKE